MTRKSTILGLALVMAAAACANDAPNAPSSDRPGTIAADVAGTDGFSYAVIGDRPYGAAKYAEMPQLIAQMNGDPAVSLVIHVGDIEAGSGTGCLDTYFDSIRAFFDTFIDPLVYTPGDNEWTDCHQYLKNNGLNTPTERLQSVRAHFFPVAGQTLGINSRHVESQANDPANSQYLENVMWTQGAVVFATVNITGSNNDLAPWSVDPATDMPANYQSYPSQADEFKARAQANAAWIAKAFDRATKTHARGVVLAFQADMWDPAESTLSGFDALVEQIGTLASQFGNPVLLLEGDSHKWRVDAPYTPGAVITPTSTLFSALHPVTPVATNVTRLVVDGSSSPTSYTRLTINPGRPKALFQLTRVPLQ